jgi:orotidine-5'-phosphate decarboxylase
MKRTQLKTLDAGRRVQGFLDMHVGDIGSTVTGLVRSQLDEAVGQLFTLHLAQQSQGTLKAA